MTEVPAVDDPLAQWWVHDLHVERYAGATGAAPETWAAPVTVTGFFSDKTSYAHGEVFSTGRFAFPADVDYIPVQSKVTLPAKFGGRVARVVATQVGDGGGLPTPDHQVIEVL